MLTGHLCFFPSQVDASKVAAGAKFKEDLGLDSLDAVEVIMACEDEVGAAQLLSCSPPSFSDGNTETAPLYPIPRSSSQ